MDKRERIAQFLDYGGNELFSSLMCEGVKYSEAIDRLVQLLCAYSDRCRFITGRSAAYRFMIARAKLNHWLGPGSNDLKSHKLTADDRERIEGQVGDYIKSGGAKKRYAKRFAECVGVVAILITAYYLVYLNLKDRIENNRLLDYYNEQIIVELKSATKGEIELDIHTTDNAPVFVFLDKMPKIIYCNPYGDEEEYEIDTACDILSDEDNRADYENTPEKLCLFANDYFCYFEQGDYKVEFSFYYVDDDGGRVDLPKKTVEFSVD